MAGFDLNGKPPRSETRESQWTIRRPVRGKAGGRRQSITRTLSGISASNNAVWFFVALIGGGAVILFTKGAFASAWPATVVAAGVVLALIVYYMLNDKDAPEEEGDNVYYLGLLFTLISLMFTLWQLFAADTESAGNSEKIHALLENFGIALTSTVVGIAGRVALLNWQRNGASDRSEFEEDPPILDPPPAGANLRDLEGFNRHLLGRIARDLTYGANALARFHRIVRSHASDTEDYLRDHSETLKRENAKVTEELRSDAKTVLDTVSDSLDSAAKRADGLLERIQVAIDDHLAALRKTNGSFHDHIRSSSAESLNALTQSFERAARQGESLADSIQSETHESFDTLRESLDAAAMGSLALAQNMSTAIERMDEAFARLGPGLQHASDASAALGGGASQAARSTAVLETEVDRLRATLVPVHSSIEAVTGMVDELRNADERGSAHRDVEQTAEAVRQVGEALRAIAADGAVATERAEQAAQSIDALTRSVRTTVSETQHAAEALRDLATEAQVRAEILRQRESSGLRFWNR